MNKEFIPYEQALELKELGFDELCYALVTEENEYHGLDLSDWQELEEDQNIGAYNSVDCVPSPLYQQAFRWFREKHNLLYTIEEVWEEDTEYYEVSITTYNRVDGIIQECTYEEAELACLKKLIELVKNK